MRKNEFEKQLSNDVPKRNPWRDDALGFSGFASILSRTILGISSPDGFVIGLSGAWGSGKTTALNFTKAYLLKYNQELEDSKLPLLIVDFEPWLFSGHTDLIAAFFQVLAEKLPDNESKSTRFGKYLGRIISGNSDSLASLVAAVGMSVDPTAGVISGAATNIGKNGIASSLNRWLATPSLQSTYARLSKRLLSDRRPILVVIDDLDRLSVDEIRSMMQMVKSVGKLPYVTYLLSYDRKHVWGALETRQDSNLMEPAFAEKIIQQELTLPQPSSSALLSILDKNIYFIAETVEPSDRWNTIVAHGIRRWIRTPRDINRYTNALKFAWPTLKNEMDSADLLAMEGLRIFEPSIFEWIKNNRDFLFSGGIFEFLDENDRSAAGKILRDLIDLKSDKSIIPLMTCLFPSRAKYISDNDQFVGEPHYQIVRRRGIGHLNAFQTYMAFCLPDDAVPYSTLQAIFENLTDEEKIYQVLNEWLSKKNMSGQHLIGELLTEIQYRLIGQNPVEPTPQLLNALFSIGTAVSRIAKTPGFLVLGPSQILYLLIADILKTYKTGDVSKNLIAALVSKRNVAYGIETFCDYGRLLGEMGVSTEGMDSPISKPDWEKFRDALVPLFEEDLASGDYLKYPRTGSTIRAFAYLNGEDKCKKWIVLSASRDSQFLLGTVKALLSEITGSTGTYFEIRNEPDTNIYDLKALDEIARKAYEVKAFANDDLKKLQAFISGVALILKG